MNEQTLTEQFDAAVAGEPPLGFDPDAVVTRARTGVRRRRALTASGGGVALVAVVAALVAGTTTGGTPDVAPGAAPVVRTTPAPAGPVTPGAAVSGEVDWPAPGTPGTTLDVPGATALQTSARTYLATRVPAVVDGVTETVLSPDNGHAGAFAEGVEVGQPPSPIQMGFSVGAGVKTATTTSELGISVKAHQAPVPSVRLDRECAKHATDPARGGTLTCSLRSTSDGGYLLVAEATIAYKEGYERTRLQAFNLVQYFRPDGVQVSAEASTMPDAPASEVLLSVEDLTELVLDPHWSV